MADADAPGRASYLGISRRTSQAVWAALAIATLPYWEVLAGRRSAMYGDVNDFAVPEYVAVWRTIRAGEWPWWTPGVFGGHSMVGAGQYAVFYPVNALFGFLDPVTAYRWWLLAHVWIGTAGAFAWSWHRFGSRLGAVVSGVAYTASGFAVLHLVHPPFVIAVAWLPFLFLGVDLVRERWSTGRAALPALALALIAFGGHPQVLWLALVGVSTYVVVTCALERDLPGLGRVGGALGIGLGLAAVQLLPLWLFSRTSQRPSLSLEAALEFSIDPRHLLTLVFPWAYGGSVSSAFRSPWLGGDTQHEVGMFAGATIVALALVGVVRRARDPAVRALGVVGVVAALLALGGSTPFGRLVFHVVPLADGFRAWGRASLLLNLALAMLAGAGARELRRAPARLVRPLGIGVAGAGVVALTLPFVSSLDEHLVDEGPGLVARSLPVVFLIWLVAAAVLLVRRPPLGAAALVVVCSLEVLAFAYPAEWRAASVPVGNLEAYYDEAVPAVFGPTADASGGIDRWVSDTYAFRMVSLAKDVHGVNGYDSILQDEWAATAAGFVYDGYPSRPDFWQPGWLADVLRVTTGVFGEHIVPTDPGWHEVGPVPEVGRIRWVRQPRLPEAYLAGRVQRAPLDDIRRALLDPDTPLATTAYVDDPDAEVAGLTDRRAAGHVESVDVLGSGRVVVDATRESLLVLSHSWQDGWHATVDGRSAPVLRTNGLVLGVVVPEGRHEVRLGFRPPGVTEGAALGLVAVVVLVGAEPLLRRRRARDADEYVPTT